MRVTKRKIGRLGTLALAIGVVAVANSAATAGTPADVEYAEAAGKHLHLDASTPDGDGPFPVAIVIHGGGWGSGDRKGDIAPLLGPLTDAKFVSFSIDYRLAPADRWPACFDDVNAAIRWAKRHAPEFKGDPRRIALIGYSAGGQLAFLAATTATPETAVQAVVGIAPPTDLELDLPQRGGLSKSLQDLLGRPKEITDESRAQLHELSAVNHVHAGLPPFLVLHGNADKSVPYAGSVAFAEKLRAAGVPCELITVEGAPHRLSEWPKYDANYTSKLTTWLRARLDPVSTRLSTSPGERR